MTVCSPLETLDSYGRMISWFHTFRFVPFYYSKSKQKILVPQPRAHASHYHRKSAKLRSALSSWLILGLYTSYVVFNSSKSIAVLLKPKVHELTKSYILFFMLLLWIALFNSNLCFLHPHVLPSIINQLMRTSRRLPQSAGKNSLLFRC